jgi:DNA adenine methylase
MQFDIESRAKPVLKWAGGKSGLLTQLVGNFPKTFSRFVEPFMGGGAVAFALKEGVPAVLNDANCELVNLYTVVRDRQRDLMLELDKLKYTYSEEFFYNLRKENPKDNVKRAARTVFLNKAGFNGLYRQNSKGQFNVPFGKRAVCPALYDSENISKVANRLATADLRNEDFELILAEAGPGDLVYCDPPYEPLSVTSSFNSYTGGGFSQGEQVRLRDACIAAAERGAVVAVSNSSADFIKTIYSEWDVRTVSAKRAINSKGNGRGEIEEVLVFLEVPGTLSGPTYSRDQRVSLDLQSSQTALT